jgi:6-phosphofructokinase 1
MSTDEAKLVRGLEKKISDAASTDDRKARKHAKQKLRELEANRSDHTLKLAHQLEQLTGLESRPSILGHLQRGGTPSAADRILATRLGTACASLINDGVSGVMVAAHGENAVPVPLEEVAGKKKLVPFDHPWIESARLVGASFGD